MQFFLFKIIPQIIVLNLLSLANNYLLRQNNLSISLILDISCYLTVEVQYYYCIFEITYFNLG